MVPLLLGNMEVCISWVVSIISVNVPPAEAARAFTLHLPATMAAGSKVHSLTTLQLLISSRPQLQSELTWSSPQKAPDSCIFNE